MPTHIEVLFAGFIFLLAYFMIIWEKVHRSVVALTGGLIMVLTGILTQTQAFQYIDFNTIGLLVGMMAIVGITRLTGVFGYLAVYSAKVAGGNPVLVLIYLSMVTAVVSALLDNVTTVLLIVPVTFSIAKQMQVNVLPFLFAEIISSNVGGTATLIGDPPNIMIGSATGLGFMDFLLALAPVIVIVFIANIVWLYVLYKKEMVTREELRKEIMCIDEKCEIQDHQLLHKCLVVIALTVLGFVLHQYLGLESATVALSGAALLLLVTGIEPAHALNAVEWPVIFFFSGLFVLVGALDHVGIIKDVAKMSLELTGGAKLPTGLFILWISAIASAFVDNIPFVATMIPLIKDVGNLGGIHDLKPFWWALSLGACLGGNGTLIGASANVVVAGLAEKRGILITFWGFTRIAFPMMLMSIVICMVYLIIFLLR